MYLNVHFKSKNFNSLKQYVKLLYAISCQYKLDLLPILNIRRRTIKQKKYTILRSPHVNKSSQEQFEFRLRSNRLKVRCSQLFKFLVILKKLKKISGFDVEISVEYRINPIFSGILKSRCLTPQTYKIGAYKNELTCKYLKLLEIYGNIRFIV